ncbi:MAG: DUF4956 domain-containing protein [Pseudomonadota bacterium]
MRRLNRTAGPIFLITCYYTALLSLVWAVTHRPDWAPWLPFGGLDALAASGANSFEVVTSNVASGLARGFDAVRLAVAIAGATLVMLPVSWVYLMTTKPKKLDQSFLFTIVMLPIVVAGTAMIVANSLALAFSLAGIFAAVRFRFTLEDPVHSLYIFLAIVVGLGAGVAALGVGLVTSIAFVYVALGLWITEYGSDPSSRLQNFLSGRDARDEEL